jgi:endonuclease V
MDRSKRLSALTRLKLNRNAPMDDAGDSNGACVESDVAARISDWCQEQKALASQVIQHDVMTWTVPPPFPDSHDVARFHETNPSTAKGAQPLVLVAGFDITPLASRGAILPDPAIASIVITQLPTLQVVYAADMLIQLQVPYIASFLGFREAPAFQGLLEGACRQGYVPQVLMVDGFGVMHPRRCGLACHLGVLTGLPCIGVAKNMLWVEGVVETATNSLPCSLSVFKVHETGEELGAAICPAGLKRPIFVSPGHKVSLVTSIEVVLACCKYRNPEPIRLADQRSRAAARQLAASAL